MAKRKRGQTLEVGCFGGTGIRTEGPQNLAVLEGWTDAPNGIVGDGSTINVGSMDFHHRPRPGGGTTYIKRMVGGVPGEESPPMVRPQRSVPEPVRHVATLRGFETGRSTLCDCGFLAHSWSSECPSCKSPLKA